MIIKKKSILYFLNDFIKPIFIGLLISLFFWFFIFKPFIVIGQSMYPAFNSKEGQKIGDYIIIELITYRFNEPERGDVIVINGDAKKGAAKNIIKRIIGTPGEAIRIKNNYIEIRNKSGIFKILDEPYVNKEDTVLYKEKLIELGINEYFVLGDNRNFSFDSRVFGAIQKENIIGKVFVRLYPFSKIDITPGN